MIVVIDYGMGNLGSIANMIKKVGGRAIVSSGKSDIESASKLILPGVGSFDNGMRKLRSLDYVSLLTRKVVEGRTPTLGICLGMQLLTRSSEEGREPGLGWIDADTVRFRFDTRALRLKIPHMGWNSVTIHRPHPLFPDDRPRRFYFVHSYYVRCNDLSQALGTTCHGIEFTSAVARDNIVGCQFHPEKSHHMGMELMRHFVHEFDGVTVAAQDRPIEAAPPAARQKARVRVIPCLLLSGQGLVKTIQFAQPTYLGDPVNIVKIFNDKSVDELGIVDIGATAQGGRLNLKLLKEIADNAYMPLSYGGGIASLDDIRRVLSIGYEKVIIGAKAFEQPGLIQAAAEQVGSQSVVVAVDVRKGSPGRYEVCTHSGKDRSGIDPVTYARRMEELGAGEILLTSIDRDGLGQGYDLELIRRVCDAVKIPVIASGGAGKVQDFADAVTKGGASAVAAASLFVFHGRRRAVLISFPSQQELDAALGA